jgi:hypothetical protein
MLFIYFIIAIFFFLAIIYFYNHSLSSAIQRSQTLKSAIQCIYHLPIFLLSVFLLYAGIINFYFFIITFFHFHDLFTESNLIAVLYFFINALFIAFLFWLSKKSVFKVKVNFVSLLFTLFYLISSVVILKIFKDNFALLLLYDFNFSISYFYNNPPVLFLSILLVFGFLLSSFFIKINCLFITYCRLSVKIVLGYFVLALSIAVVSLFLKFVAFLISFIFPK